VKVSHKAVAELIASLYEAATDRAQWELFLNQLASIISGRKAALILHDCERPQINNIAVSIGMAPEAQRGYDEYYAKTDEWARHGHRLFREGWVGTSQMMCPDEVLLRSEFYNDFLIKHEMFHEIACIVDQKGPSVAVITVLRPRRAGAFGEEAVQFLKFMMPHMQRAVQLHSRVADLQSRATRNELALHSLSVGIVFTDAHGAIIQMNRCAETLFRQNDGLLLTKNGMRAAIFQEDQKLQSLLRDAFRTAPAPAVASSSTLLISRTRSKGALAVFVTPIRPSGNFAPEKACAAVFINDPDAKLQPPLRILETLYGLTAAEARLAILLLNGASLTQASEINGSSRNTTRTHLQHLFDKLGVKRQSELVALLLRTIGPIF
jgi:DNA-binding CsgD family transcriptional regulator